MKQSDLVKVAGGVVVGVVLAAVLGAGVFGLNLSGDRETDVTLSQVGAGGSCTLGKATQVRVRQDKHLIWKIENYCTEGSKTITVGNFRTDDGPSAANDCSDAGAAYPFTDATLAARTSTVDPAERQSNGSLRPSKDDIKLKGNSPLASGENERLYRFDICLDGRKVDPELVFER